MSETKNQNRNVRVIALAALLLIVGGLAAAPTASAATFASGSGCVGTYVGDPGGSTWELFLGKIGKLVDCIV